MKPALFFLSLGLATPHLHAEESKFRVLVDAPREQRSLVKITASDGIRYGVCAGSPTQISQLESCSLLGQSLPDTAATRRQVSLNFQRALDETITAAERATSPGAIIFSSAFSATLATGFEIAIRRYFGGNPALTARRLGTSFVSWMLADLFFQIPSITGWRNKVQQLKPLGQGGPNAGLGYRRSLETTPSLILGTSDEMDAVIAAMTTAIESTRGAR